MKNKRLVKSRSDRMVFGVAAGIAAYFDIDPIIVRLIFVLLTLMGGHGILIYLILAVIMPDTPVTPAPSAKANAFDEDEIVIKRV